MKKTFLSIILLLTTFVVKAGDPVNGGFLSLKNAYDFDLPNLDLSLALPGGAGFRVPFWDENNAFLNINEDNVSYCFNPEVLEYDDCTFTYSLPGSTVKDVSLTLIKLDEEGKESLSLSRIKESDLYISELPSIKGELGSFDGFFEKYDEEINTRTYLLFKDDLLILFSVFASEPKKIVECEKIIRSLKNSDLEEKRKDYFEKVENGYFSGNDKESAPSSYSFINDTLHTETVFKLPAFGIEMSFPKGWNYGIAINPEKLRKEQGHIDINWNKEDIDQSSLSSFHAGDKDMIVFTYIYPKTNESRGSIENLLKQQKTIKKFPVVVDGLVTEASAVGPDYMPTVYFHLELNSCIVLFSYMSITSDKLSTVESLISEIRIAESEKKGLPAASEKIKPITKLLDIKKFKVDGLPEIKLTLSDNNSIPKVPAEFSDAGISFMIPKGDMIYAFPEENNVKDKEKVIVKGKPDLTTGNLSVTSSFDNTGNMISVTLSYLSDGTEFEKYFDMMVKNWETYEMIDIKQAGFVTVNGHKWCIMNYTQTGYSAYMIMTFHKDCMITVSHSGNDDRYRTLTNDMIFSFKFK